MAHTIVRGETNEVREHLFDVWTVTTDPGLDFETKLARLFELETTEFHLPYGFLSRIDRTTNTQTIETAHGSHDLLQDGEVSPLSESYCRETIQQPDGLFSVDDAVTEGWTDDPAYERFGLGTYLGATVEVESRLYGTLCFASSEPREEPLSGPERQLIDHLARWASNELQARTTRARLQQQSDQVEELARVVSHDLRNPLNIAQGQVQLLEDSIQEAVQQIDAAHQRMSTIIEQMLVLARVDEPVEDPSVIDLRDCVSEAWRLVPTGDATLEMDLDGARIVADRDRLGNLLENLFRNAVEHGSTGNRAKPDDAVEYGGDAVTVEVGLTESGGGFYVADDGPGIPVSRREEVFDPGYSTTSDGTGFGLSIVDRIADAHGWSVHITESSRGGAKFEITGIEFAPRDTD